LPDHEAQLANYNSHLAKEVARNSASGDGSAEKQGEKYRQKTHLRGACGRPQARFQSRARNLHAAKSPDFSGLFI